MIKLDDSILKEIYGPNIPIIENSVDNLYRKLLADYLKNNLRTGKISKLFFEQLLHLPETGMRYTYEWILDEIAYLEGIKKETRSLKAQNFRGDYLKGLWKKHFYIPRLHIAKNFANALKLEQEDSKIIPEIFNATIKKYKLDETSSDKTKEKASDFMAKASVACMENKKQSGDWIIFAKNNGINYYLCVVPHSNKSPDDDIRIKELCKKCIDEFPFLASIF